MACLFGCNYNAFFPKIFGTGQKSKYKGKYYGAEIFLTKEEERNRFCGCLDEIGRRDLVGFRLKIGGS